MSAALTGCPAPAKLNLFLHVTGRRADGYHLLQSVFVLLDRADTLDFTLRADGAIVRTTDVPGVPAAQDRTVRALQALARASAARGRPVPGIEVALTKRLPMGGGLGGGSSDAATALLAANHLWQCGFTRAELMALGLPLGADIPFFLGGGPAFAEGVGEALTPLTLPETWFVVLEPGVQVPTGPIFTAPDLTRDTKPITIADFSKHVATHGILRQFGRNDLQPVATRLFAPVAQALAWLGQFGDARMSGSGACVFCAMPSAAAADAVLAQASGRWTGWKARSLARHPMLTRLQGQ
jgi:4-diphosphocytidyl-2-C-methyl-D-erythritol kinase